MTAHDTPEHEAERMAWAMEQAEREAAMFGGVQHDGLAAINAEFDRASGYTVSKCAAIRSRAYCRAIAQAYQITLPPCPPRSAGVRAVADWAKRSRGYQQANAKAVYAAMAEDADFVAAEADRRRRRIYTDRAASRDLCRDWMTTAEAAAEASRQGD